MAVQQNVVEETAEKVDIPDTCVESDAESDTLSEKLRKIDAYNDGDYGGYQANENNSNQQVWFMEEDARDVAATQELNIELQI